MTTHGYIAATWITAVTVVCATGARIMLRKYGLKGTIVQCVHPRHNPLMYVMLGACAVFMLAAYVAAGGRL